MNWDREDKIYKYTNIFLILLIPITIILLIFITWIIWSHADALPNNVNLPFNKPSIECGTSQVIDNNGRQARVCIDFNTNCQWYENASGNTITNIHNSCRKHYVFNQNKQ